MKRIPTALLILLAIAGVASGQDRNPIVDSGRRTMTAERLQAGERILLDGRLDEPAWKRALPAKDFIEQEPVLGGTPSEPTEVRIVYDGDHLYMGVTCYDSEPDKLLGNTMKRDEFLSADDRFMWTMDTFLDQRSGYFFEMNPSGLMADALMGAGGGNSREWDGIWNARVRQSEIGWTIEIDIPFRTLNFDPNAPAWGINFQRTVRRKNEESLWTGHLRNQGLRRMSNAGLLIGINDVGQGKGIDVKPYAAATLADAPGRPTPERLKGSGDIGLDVLYNLTPSLRSTLTVNTDFAETEVDQRRVNLTRFPLFFPEKRTFFLDGATFFDFYRARGVRNADAPVQPFFSRRAGLDENGRPQTIQVGAKLTGQAGAHDLGLLYVRTGETGAIAGEDFAALRLKRRVLTQSYVGGLYTRRHTRIGGASDLQTAGFDFRLATSRFRGSNNLELDGFFLWNTNPLDTGRNLAYGVTLGYPNDRWEGTLAFNEVQRHHDPALGFTPRLGYQGFNPALRFSPRPRSRWVRRLGFGGNVDLLTDPDNRFLTRELDFTLIRVEMHSQDNVEISVVPQYERLEQDFEIHSGIVLPSGADYEFTRDRISANTANRRVLALRSRVEWGSFFSGRRREVVLALGVRPRPGVTVNLETEWNRVNLVEGRFETRLFRVVADTQFNPWTYLVNNLQYDSVSGVVGWQSRLRWILTPGNDLYVVYTHNWLDTPGLDRFVTQDRRAATKFVYTHRF
jgi:hypothetical protein